MPTVPCARILLGPLISVGLGKERQLSGSTRTGAGAVVGGDPGRPPRRGQSPRPASTSRPGPSRCRPPTASGTSGAASTASTAWSPTRPGAIGGWPSPPSPRSSTRQAERDETVTLPGSSTWPTRTTSSPTPCSPIARTTDRVALTTLHQSKGLEFDVVFIANAVEGVFPDLRRSRRMLRPELLSPERTVDASALHLFQVQEEMRLAYTAMTRARLRVVWTATNAGIDQGEHRPSRFLVAASGAASIASSGRRGEDERPPVTVMEAEVAMRRTALDPAPARRRTAGRDQGPGGSRRALVGACGLRRCPRSRARPAHHRARADRLSPSQADSYATCPRRYALERRLRLGDAGSPLCPIRRPWCIRAWSSPRRR